MSDPYHQIYQGEVFVQSRCIWHENTLMDFFRSNLISLGYHSVSDNNKTWQRGDRTVVVCLVDDITTCKQDWTIPNSYLFDSNTVVITDNQINLPTQYTVKQLPASFFGIYHYTPENCDWQPDRRFNFSVNRLDQKRMSLMLELWKRIRGQPSCAVKDYINFNCWAWNGNNTSEEGLRQNFQNEWDQLPEPIQKAYTETFASLLPRMPWKTHALNHEQSHVKAWLNVVAETYSSDTTIALSEKTFRALSLPVPWALYAGKHTVAWLTQMGFDTCRDIIAHKYDTRYEIQTATYGDKSVDFISECNDFVDFAKKQNFETIKTRFQNAADHNRKVLADMAARWPADFAQWIPGVIKEIA